MSVTKGEIGLGIAGILTGGIASLIGSYWEGEISEKQFSKELAFKNRELAERIKSEAARLGFDEKQLKQQWTTFVTDMTEKRRQFDAQLGLSKGELGEKKREFNLSYGLQKQDLEHKKFMDLVNPIIEQHRKSKNLLTAFSAIAKGGQGAAPVPAAPGAPAPAPAGGGNPLTSGFASSTPTNPLTA
jgi:hypothetical protein